MPTSNPLLAMIRRFLDRLMTTSTHSPAVISDSAPAADPAGLAARLREQEERTRSILASMREVVWSFSPNFEKLLYVNQAAEAVLGYPSEAFFSQPDLWVAIIHPDDRQMILNAIHEYGGLGWSEFHYRVIHPNGNIRWIRSRSRVIRDASGAAVQVDGVCVDVTEQKLLEDVLKNRDAILDAVGWAAGRLLTASAWQDHLPEILSQLGRAMQASHACMYQTIKSEPGKTSLRRLHQWTAEGLAPLSRPPSQGSEDRAGPLFDLWAEALSSGQVVQKRASQFQEQERNYFLPLGVDSIIAVPILLEGSWWGLIGFDDSQTERRWLPAEEDALKAAANMLANAILRRQAEEQLHQILEVERDEHQASAIIRDIATVFNQSLNYDRILDLVLEQLPRLIPYDGACILLVLDEKAHIARQRGYTNPVGGLTTRSDGSSHWVKAVPGFNAGISLEHSLPGRSFEINKIPYLRAVKETHQTKIIGDTQVDPAWVHVIAGWPYRSAIGSALLSEGQVEAILSLDKIEPHFYTRAHAERLALFASQASLALHNARLFGNILDTLEREEHLSEITRAISSELDLPTILRSVTRLAVEMTDAEAGSIAILSPDNRSLSDSYLYNLPQELNQGPYSPGKSLAWETVLTHHSILLKDYSAHPKANPDWVTAGVKAFIGVPIIVGNTCLGGVGIYAYNPKKEFEARDLALVEMVGRQAGIAIQNARLYEAAQRRAAEAETLRQAALAVNSALALDKVLEKILEQLKTVVPYDSASIFLLEENYLRIKAGRGFTDLPSLMAQRFSLHNPLIEAIESSGSAIIIPDVFNDPRFENWGEADQIHGWMGLSLHTRSEQIGFLSIDSYHANAYSEADGELAQAFANEAAIAIENARLFEQVQRLAITDPLTNIYNRRYFFEGGRREFERARRYGLPLSLILLDLDHFKLVNDTYGHLAGDRMLVAVASRCKSVLREVDVLARYGGEEFIFLLPQTNLEGAIPVAERLRGEMMNQAIDAGGQHIQVSASLGIAELDETCLDLQDLIHHADMALYHIKNHGRGSIAVWNGETNS